MSEEPKIVGHLVEAIERHDKQADDEIGNGERGNEIVRDRLEIAFANHGRNDEHVAKDRDQRDRRE